MFDFFKKKKKQEEQGLHYDPSDVTVSDIRRGFLLDYDLQTWVAEEEFEYDWGNNLFSYEFKLTNAKDTIYLSLDEERSLVCTILRPLKFAKLGDEVEKAIIDNEKPPRSITYEGTTYYRERERPGYFRNIQTENWEEFIMWKYVDDTEKKILIIEQWDVEEFEAWIGIVVPENAISNILPNQS
jgi:hypothetical protein